MYVSSYFFCEGGAWESDDWKGDAKEKRCQEPMGVVMQRRSPAVKRLVMQRNREAGKRLAMARIGYEAKSNGEARRGDDEEGMAMEWQGTSVKRGAKVRRG